MLTDVVLSYDTSAYGALPYVTRDAPAPPSQAPSHSRPLQDATAWTHRQSQQSLTLPYPTLPYPKCYPNHILLSVTLPIPPSCYLPLPPPPSQVSPSSGPLQEALRHGRTRCPSGPRRLRRLGPHPRSQSFRRSSQRRTVVHPLRSPLRGRPGGHGRVPPRPIRVQRAQREQHRQQRAHHARWSAVRNRSEAARAFLSAQPRPPWDGQRSRQRYGKRSQCGGRGTGKSVAVWTRACRRGVLRQRR